VKGTIREKTSQNEESFKRDLQEELGVFQKEAQENAGIEFTN